MGKWVAIDILKYVGKLGSDIQIKGKLKLCAYFIFKKIHSFKQLETDPETGY